ncbi:MAG TPA: response regulator, partial [Bryobacteraceae bacterium]|nr:response regulator [Bryobacteraceae bacterium]
ALTSEPGRGTEFRVYFPIAEALIKEEPEERPFRAHAGTGTILVVDDEPMVTRTARLALQKCGYTVLTAQNGREAVDLFRALANEIDLVLLDMTMPVMPGDIAFQQIRAIRSNVRVIASSGYDEAEASSRFGEDLDGFIQKPYKAGQLAEKVHEILSKRPAARGAG